ncbi:MAG: kelch repeat-containing protein [Trueperaceae bacterium]|nr:kelch repeat-containing protein [Trueperaceae bacterium]
MHDPTGTVVMFGGGVPVEGGFQPFSETWLFDPVEERWSQLSFEEGATPQAEIGEMFAYHEAADLFVLHGGFTLDGMRFLNDTWHFDLGERTWTKVEPATSPPGMNYKAFAYDPRTEQLVLSGGVVEEVDDTWTYDPRDPDWQHHEKLPETRWVDYVRMVYDPNLDTLIRFGGTNEDEGAVWSVSEDLEWSLLDIEGESPPRMNRHAMTAVPGLGVLVYGGVYRGRPTSPATCG